jgi:polysaccharide export outer membrane protein
VYSIFDYFSNQPQTTKKASRIMSRIKKLLQALLLISLMAALPACATNPSAAPADSAAPAPVDATSSAKEASPAASRDTYIVQPGDVLSIDVWKEKDLLREITVRPDGGLNFPLIGDVVAAGKTIEQLKTDIASKLSKYIPDPVVNVAIKQAQGYKIYVVGKVNKPGEFYANRNVDVMQALSMAGGPNPYAAVNKIKIIRRINGEQKTFIFKYSRVEKGEDLEQNIVLQGGDVVVVP